MKHSTLLIMNPKTTYPKFFAVNPVTLSSWLFLTTHKRDNALVLETNMNVNFPLNLQSNNVSVGIRTKPFHNPTPSYTESLPWDLLLLPGTYSICSIYSFCTASAQLYQKSYCLSQDTRVMPCPCTSIVSSRRNSNT